MYHTMADFQLLQNLPEAHFPLSECFSQLHETVPPVLWDALKELGGWVFKGRDVCKSKSFS